MNKKTAENLDVVHTPLLENKRKNELKYRK